MTRHIPAVLSGLMLCLIVTAPAAAVDEVIRDAVDPYIPGAERVRFLAAAGVDSELDEPEFKKNANAPDPFVRKYDAWPTMKRFDKNGNDSLDWFEANAYRTALRQAVLDAYDSNKDNRLANEERAAANEALASGKVPRISPETDPRVTTQPRSPSGGQSDGQGRIEWDTDGDGRMSAEERQAYYKAQQERWRQQQRELIEKYDTDGDGQWSNEERQAYYKEQREQWEQQQRETIEKYDANGNGRLDGDEWQEANRARMEEWKKNNPEAYARWEQQQEQWRQQQREMIEKYDANGNGRMDGDEWQEANRARMEEWRRNNPEQAAEHDKRMEDWRRRNAELIEKYDRNGDGELNTEEWQEVNRERMEEWRRNNPEQAAEHDKRMEEYRKRQAELIEKYDANGNGRLDGDEWRKARESGDAPGYGGGVVPLGGNFGAGGAVRIRQPGEDDDR